MKRPMILIALMAAALTTGGCERLSNAAFDAKVKAYILENPEVIEEAMTNLAEERAAEAEAQSQRASAVLVPRYRKAIENDKRDFVANPKGTVTVTEFFDYRCGYCRRAAADIIELIRTNPDVRFVFKEFPILSEESHDAAALALAAHRQGKYLNIYQGFYGPGQLTPEAMDAAIRQAGMDPTALRKAAKDPAITKHLEDTHRLARDLRIDGTPAFVVGDVIIPGADMDRLKFEIAKAKASG